MNTVVIFFVPLGATQPDFDIALRDYLESLEPGRNTEQETRTKHAGEAECPLWTCFLPNPCP
jgi:hypothetical protein